MRGRSGTDSLDRADFLEAGTAEHETAGFPGRWWFCRRHVQMISRVGRISTVSRTQTWGLPWLPSIAA